MPPTAKLNAQNAALDAASSPVQAERSSQNGGTGQAFIVSALELGDINEFLTLQDLFAGDHQSFTKDIYPKVGLREWQLKLLCPVRILEQREGRQLHAQRMIEKEQECFRRLQILKATTRSNGSPPTMVGYIMFQVHEPEKRKGRQKRGAADSEGYWLQVKQIFVRQGVRQHGCGKLLFDSMLKAVGPEEQLDIRLCVLDLNTVALRWYRSQDFLVAGLTKEFLGDRNDANVVVFQEMRRLTGIRRPELLAVPYLFRHEVIGEVITVSYPDMRAAIGEDGSPGVFVVRIMTYAEADHFHTVDSEGLSVWQNESFEDIIDLNAMYQKGYIEFERHLCVIHREAELMRRDERRRKAEAKEAANEALKRQRSWQATQPMGARPSKVQALALAGRHL